MAEPIQIKILETLNNLLDMYEYRNEEVLVLEAIANGIDAKAKRISIELIRDESNCYIVFLNDGSPMKPADFDRYHTISSSTKTKGEGIGFAGVGAKIFLAAWDQAEIVTVTGKNNDVFVSRMFRQGDDVQYDSSLKGTPVQQMVGSGKLDHKYGTSYKVKVSPDGYNWLQGNISEKLRFWFNDALLSKKLELYVNGKSIVPWQPEGEKISVKIKAGSVHIPCHIWICKEDTPEDMRHIVYSVFGKRIKNESVDWANLIKGNNSKKIFCMADVSILASHLVANKENFKKNTYTNKIRGQINKRLFGELEKRKLIFKPEDITSKTNVVVNELTKRLDKILQNPELKFLNPFSNPREHDISVANKDGDVRIGEGSGKQTNKTDESGNERGDGGEKEGGDATPAKSPSGDDDGTGSYQDDLGDKKGVNKTKKTRGIYIIPEDFPDDPREGWVDVQNRAIVYNTGHPFSKSVSNNASLYDYNLTRVVISALIKAKNDQKEMDAVEALEKFEKILHAVWV